jgi:hypothetical protein
MWRHLSTNKIYYILVLSSLLSLSIGKRLSICAGLDLGIKFWLTHWPMWGWQVFSEWKFIDGCKFSYLGVDASIYNKRQSHCMMSCLLFMQMDWQTLRKHFFCTTNTWRDQKKWATNLLVGNVVENTHLCKNKIFSIPKFFKANDTQYLQQIEVAQARPQRSQFSNISSNSITSS